MSQGRAPVYPAAVAPDRRRVVVENVRPRVDDGRWPIKRIVGEPVVVWADVFADGHDVLRVVLRYRQVDRAGRGWIEQAMVAHGNDVWAGVFVPEATGYMEYTVAGWVDGFASWRHALHVKFDAGDAVESELLEGAAMVRRTAAAVAALPAGRGAVAAGRRAARHYLEEQAAALESLATPETRVAAAMADELSAAMTLWTPPLDPETAPPLVVRVERERAGFAAWYEMFPRSETPDPTRSATFDEAARRLPAVADMAFDVVYLPPIHPIGTTARRGPNNQPQAAPGDVGSPWAIGSPEGGHTAVHPALGTVADFERFVARAGGLGLEIALDIAFQCSPDHPWVREHPEWFRHRPDGTIKYAENPPKKYPDIYPLDFECEAWRSLWQALKEVFEFWIAHGVRTFRVDNPHTKPFPFWAWLIAEVQRSAPDAVFLSEAFTRPKLMRQLAKAGFTQSYSYFTWRNTKAELTEYFTELAHTEVREYLRANLFTNTPDILHAFLQGGGRPAFAIRLLLAATLGSLYGIYSGFELGENAPVRAGSEEYLDSEKYQLRPRDWSRPDSLAPLITRVNQVRRRHAAFRPGSRLDFHATDSDQLLCYSRTATDGDRLLIVVNLDPHRLQHGWIDLPADAWGLPAAYDVRDELTGETFTWHGGRNYVRLDPAQRAGHVFVMPPAGTGGLV